MQNNTLKSPQINCKTNHSPKTTYIHIKFVKISFLNSLNQQA